MREFERRDEIRRIFSSELLLGKGVEIGAGAYPQQLPTGAEARYYDVRSDAEAAALFRESVVSARPMSRISLDFPNGADFLIAHNVLEHSPNPIGLLLTWNRYVRRGGRVVVSLPHFKYCPDRGRYVPPLAHLIADFLFDADGLDFSSREHSASFTLGWSDDFCRAEQIDTLQAFSLRVLAGLHRDDHDLHWHALDTNLSLGIVAAAAALDATAISGLRCWSPESGQTVGDILISYHIDGRECQDAAAKELVAVGRSFKAHIDALSSRFGRRILELRAGEDAVDVLAGPFSQEGQYCFFAKLPHDFVSRIKPGMVLSVREDNHLLASGNAIHETIRRHGHGLYSFWNDDLYFSSSDGTDCNRNGRHYTVHAEWRRSAPDRSDLSRS